MIGVTRGFLKKFYAPLTALNLKANSADLKEIGVEQTWQNVTASRAFEVTYTNSLDKPIFVMIDIRRLSTAAFGTSITIDGHIFNDNYIYAPYDDRYGTYLTFIIPSGSTYKLHNASYSYIHKWLELRE